MLIDKLVALVNEKLAGETLMYEQLKGVLDSTIDDINIALNSCFPTFTEFSDNSEAFPKYPDYNFFPERYIRSVVALGAAYKFYTIDEEGAEVAPEYKWEYKTALFYMTRDFSHLVPTIFQLDYQGYLMLGNSCDICVPDQAASFFNNI